MNLTERITMLELRMRYVEDQLGINSDPNKIIYAEQPKEEPVKEELVFINGFSKSQLLTMFGWAKNFKLQQLSKNDFEELKKWRVLKDFYPNAPENYEDIIL